MFEADVIEFPFVQEMPKREKSRLVKVWEQFKELSRITEEKGMLVPQVYVAKLLGVSVPRVDQLASEGRLERLYIGGQAFITENSVLDMAATERKTGRPVKIMGVDVGVGTKEPSKRELWEASKQFAKELRKK